MPALAGMAIRYSGDVEIRIQYGGARFANRSESKVIFNPSGTGFYSAHIRAPYIRNQAVLSIREIGLTQKQDPLSSESYDKAALAFIKWSELHIGPLPIEFDERNQVVVRRVFQSPCPIRT